jgi:hypothetical protein
MTFQWSPTPLMSHADHAANVVPLRIDGRLRGQIVYADIREAGCRAWQLALTVPMGRAADRPELLLQPPELLDLFPLLNELAVWAQRDNILLFPGNNIGYYGPYERRLRGGAVGGNVIWDGCQAGIDTLGIEADGTTKGCPSLPTSAYSGGTCATVHCARFSSTRPYCTSMAVRALRLRCAIYGASVPPASTRPYAVAAVPGALTFSSAVSGFPAPPCFTKGKICIIVGRPVNKGLGVCRPHDW